MLYAKEKSNMYLDSFLEVIDEVKVKIGDRPVYLTLDIDVLDPAFCARHRYPGSGGHNFP
jgi:agmatinase